MSLRLIACLLFLLPSSLLADDWDALKQPGAIALMRHALAPGGGDPDGFTLGDFTLGDCSTQRNLDARGRDQARRIGAALREQGIVFDEVWSSAWCRTRETAQLVEIGEVEIRPSLNSFFAGQGNRQSQTAETMRSLTDLNGTARVLLVSHQVNITALTGVTPSSGEIIVARMQPDGQLEVTGRVNIAP
jgi:phosphohistidine phosphatase SixA